MNRSLLMTVMALAGVGMAPPDQPRAFRITPEPRTPGIAPKRQTKFSYPHHGQRRRRAETRVGPQRGSHMGPKLRNFTGRRNRNCR